MISYYDEAKAKTVNEEIETPLGKVSFRLVDGRYLYVRGNQGYGSFKVRVERDLSAGSSSELADTWSVRTGDKTSREFSGEASRKRAKILAYIEPRAQEWLVAHKAEIKATRLASVREEAWTNARYAESYRERAERLLAKAEAEENPPVALTLVKGVA